MGSVVPKDPDYHSNHPLRGVCASLVLNKTCEEHRTRCCKEGQSTCLSRAIKYHLFCFILFILLLYSKEHFSSKTVRIAKGPLGSLSQDLSNFTVTLLLNPMEQRMGTKTLRSSHMVWILLPRGPQWEEQYLISSYHTQRSQSMGDTGKTKPGDQPPDARSPHTPYVRAHDRAVLSSTR